MAREYSTSVTPFRTMVCGLPISTFTATIISLILYALSIILILATKCPMNARLGYFLAFLIIAVLATCCMAAINMMYTRYHFNCLSLSVSLLYSGSAALVTLGLVVTLLNGMCGVKKETISFEPPRPSVPTTPVPKLRNLVIEDEDGSRASLGADRKSSRDLFASDNSPSLFKSGHVGSYFIWSMAAIADAFQIVAHYYYG